MTCFGTMFLMCTLIWCAGIMGFYGSAYWWTPIAVGTLACIMEVASD